MKKIDFHIHTHFSYDSLMQPEKIIDIARKKGLDGIVICDHNTVKGALEALKKNRYKDFVIIPAAEIKTDIGDVTGLFITKDIMATKFDDVVKAIKSQKGLVLLNHPYHHHKLDKIDFGKVDFIEGYNSRLDNEKNQKAILLAQKHNIPILAGSDAHLYNEIGCSYTIIKDFDDFTIISHHYKKTSDFNIIISQYIKAFKRRSLLVFISTTKILIKTTLKKLFTKNRG